MNNTEINIKNSKIGAYIEKNEGEINLMNRKLLEENKILKERVIELESEIKVLKQAK